MTDSKSVGSNTVRVRPPPSAPKSVTPLNEWGYTFYVLVGGRTRNLRVVHGCTIAVAQSRYARMHNDSHTKPLHDATAQMAVDAQMQRPKRPQFDNPAPLPLQQTGIALLFLVLGGANSHGAGKARMPYKMNARRL